MELQQSSASVDNNTAQLQQEPSLRRKLDELAANFGVDLFSEDFAKQMDEVDPLRQFRKRFCIPTMKDLPCVDPDLVKPDDECIYLCGNSLGLKPATADAYMQDVLDCWRQMGVLMHFNGKFPAAYCDLLVKDSTAQLVGASDPSEVAVMNGLSVNLNSLMIAFYKPTSTRFKIMIEDHAFPSDRYSVVSHLKLHGYTADEALLIVKPRPGESTIRHEDFLSMIAKHGREVALCLFSGVHYYTGQKFDIEDITRAAKKEGCVVGWDLAHAVGNVKLKLAEWDVDFACWCSYKYLNSGAGGIGGAYVNRRFHQEDMNILSGWWGNRTETRFEMRHVIDRAEGADAFRMCNPPPWLVALHKASLEIFEDATMDRIVDKQLLLTGYLECLIDKANQDFQDGTLVQIITPRDPAQRGCQLSLSFSISLKKVHDDVEKRGILCDIRLPSAMRLAPAPLYNSFEDVYRFIRVLREVLELSSTS